MSAFNYYDPKDFVEPVGEDYFPSDAAEPVDDFDYDYPDYPGYDSPDYPDYAEGFRDGNTCRTDTLTIIVPTGLRFTLTVN